MHRAAPDDRTTALLAGAFAGLRPLAGRLAGFDARLKEMDAAGPQEIKAQARALRRRIRSFEPSVTMIGQVKAGKTTLVNAMTGWQGLLPADVNPWTSVVTALRQRPGPAPRLRNASFQFFTEAEWGHLLQRGGRMGELAQRAGADDELDKVRAQLETMREKSRERLGNRFELLLGQSHDYDSFDAELIERYVCLGDDFWETAGSDDQKGRFADITRSADLWFDQPALPHALCIRDTPGVNDTFMIREQITINALRGSRLCVMVLSASQALTSVDLALIRMISNVASRDVIIFVNRMDELKSPATEVPLIRESIRETLARHGGPTEAQVIFGCGSWAQQALSGGIEDLSRASAESLLNWAESRYDEENPFETLEEMVWHLSGVQELGDAIANRIAAGAGAQLIAELEAGTGNLDIGRKAASRTARPGQGGGCRLTLQALEARIDEIDRAAQSALIGGLKPLRQSLTERMESSRRTFVSRAAEAAVKHLEAHGEMEIWTYDPCGLRVLLRSGYQRYVKATSQHGSACLAAAATELGLLYAEAFDLDGEATDLAPPPLPQAEPPVVLGQTIALDMRGSWWSRFWRRRKSPEACAADFAALLQDETQPIMDRLGSENAARFETAVLACLTEFLASHRRMLLDMAARSGSDSASPEQPVAAQRRNRPAPGAAPRLETSR